MVEKPSKSADKNRRKVLQATGSVLCGTLTAPLVSATEERSSSREKYMELISRRQRENLHVREWRRLLIDEGFEVYFDDIGRVTEVDGEEKEVVLYPTIVPIDSGTAFVDLGWEQWHRTPDGSQDFQIFDLPEGTRRIDSYQDERATAEQERNDTFVHRTDSSVLRGDLSERSVSVDPFAGYLVQSDSISDFEPQFGFMRTGRIDNLPINNEGLTSRGHSEEELDFSSIYSKDISGFYRNQNRATPMESHSSFVYYLSENGYSAPDMVETQLRSLGNHVYNRTGGDIDLIVSDYREIGVGTVGRSESEFVEASINDYVDQSHLTEGSHFLVAHDAWTYGYGGGKFEGTINGKQAWGEAVCTAHIVPNWEQRHFVWHETLHMLGGTEGDHYRGCYNPKGSGGGKWAEEITPLAFGYVYDSFDDNSISYGTNQSNFENDHYICGEGPSVDRPNPNSLLDHGLNKGKTSWTYSITGEIEQKIVEKFGI